MLSAMGQHDSYKLNYTELTAVLVNLQIITYIWLQSKPNHVM